MEAYDIRYRVGKGSLDKLLADSVCYFFEDSKCENEYPILFKISREKRLYIDKLSLNEVKQLKKELRDIINNYYDNLKLGVIKDGNFEFVEKVVMGEPYHHAFISSLLFDQRRAVIKDAKKEVKDYIKWAIEKCDEIIKNRC